MFVINLSPYETRIQGFNSWMYTAAAFIRVGKGMSQMYIVPNTENGIVNWLEPVSDIEYHSK